MTLDHERIDELLAGYALRALDDGDREEADRLLAEHVPSCARCRTTLLDFQAVAGELSLAAPPADPPELLLPRLRRDIAAPDAISRQRRPVSAWITTAVAVAIAGLTSWNAILNNQLGHVRANFSSITDAVTFMSQPDSTEVGLPATAEGGSDMVMSSTPEERSVWLVGSHIPTPPAGTSYVLWLGKDGRYDRRNSFLPVDGQVVVHFTFNPLLYDEVLVTEEDPLATGSEPSPEVRWTASLEDVGAA